MQLTKVNEIPDRYKRTALIALVDAFISSGDQICRVDDYPYKNVYTGAAALRNAAERFGFPMDVIISRSKVYLKRRDG